MLATRDEAAKKFAGFVKKAQGRSYLVYLAFSQLENPSDAQVEEFLEKKLKEEKLDEVA